MEMMLSRLPYHDSLKLLEADIHHANALYVFFSCSYDIFFYIYNNQISKFGRKKNKGSLLKLEIERVIIMFNLFSSF